MRATVRETGRIWLCLCEWECLPAGTPYLRTDKLFLKPTPIFHEAPAAVLAQTQMRENYISLPPGALAFLNLLTPLRPIFNIHSNLTINLKYILKTRDPISSHLPVIRPSVI